MTRTRSRSIVLWGLAIGLGLGLGLGSAVAALLIVPRLGMVEREGWTGHPAAGSAQASPYARAMIARIGLLAMTREEAVYLDRVSDDEGRPLRSACRYAMDGGDMPAGWWSVTLYADDNYLARNGNDAPSVDATSVAGAQGRWRAEIGPERPSDDRPWIASGGSDHFTLTLRLYQPTADVFDPGTAFAPPRVTLIDCSTPTGGDAR